jgi:hypothetical protein
MRWLKAGLKNSIYGMLGASVTPTDSVLETGTEDIRESMLTMLGDGGPKQFPQITRRIRYANDIQALWYLRGDLMAALSTIHGESEARAKIASLSEMFRGLLPGGLNSRPSPLIG